MLVQGTTPAHYEMYANQKHGEFKSNVYICRFHWYYREINNQVATQSNAQSAGPLVIELEICRKILPNVSSGALVCSISELNLLFFNWIKKFKILIV